MINHYYVIIPDFLEFSLTQEFVDFSQRGWKKGVDFYSYKLTSLCNGINTHLIGQD